MPGTIHPSFAKGEISPSLYGRVDTAMYQVGLRTARNAIIHHTGGVSNRAGTLNIAPVKDHTVDTTRLFDFQFNTDDQYALIFGELYMWVIRNDLLVTNTPIAITAATQANPVVLTVTQTYTDGDTVWIDDVVGMTELNGKYYTVDSATGTTIELLDQVTGVAIDSSAFTAYVSGGTTADVFELTTPYAAADLDELDLNQSADTITICHKGYAPRDLTRTGHNAWSLDIITFLPGIAAPTGMTVTNSGASETTVYRYRVTALADETLEESLPALNNTAETITGATAANPVVLTITAHPYADGDEIEVNSIVGMTELNGRRFRVTDSGANDVTLIGEDGTNHTAYSSGGTANRTFVELATGTDAAPDNIIAWTGVTGAARYAVYRNDNGSYGLIGETDVVSVVDENVTADLTIAPPSARNPFLFTDNYPRCSTYYEQRQVYGGTVNKPDTTWYSRTGARKNMSASTPSQADDAITAALTSRQVNEIRHFVPGNDLLVMTSGGEWRVNSGGNNAFEASTLRQKPQSEWGSSFNRPLSVGNTVMFVEENKARIRSLGYSLNVDGYTGSDMTLLANHLLADEGPTRHTVVDWCLSHYPEPRFYVVRSDGKVLTLTFNQEQEVIAWTIWDTEGAYEACTSLKKAISGVEDGVYFIVKRTVNGNTVRHVERQHTRKFPNLDQAYFVDDGVTYDGDPVDITALTFGSIVVTVGAGHGFIVGQSVYLSEVQWLCDTDNGAELNTDFLNDEIYVVSATDTTTVTLSTLTGLVQNIDVEPEFARNATDITWNGDGTIAYITGDQGGLNQDMETEQYVCSTVYDFSTKAASSGNYQWSSSSSAWTSRMLWDDNGYRAVQWEMRTGPSAAEFLEYDAGATTVAISAITNASPGVLTTAVHSMSTNDVVKVESVGGMTELNDTFYKVVVLSTTTFSLKDIDTDAAIDTTAFGIYTSGGTIRKIVPYDITELTANGNAKDIASDISFDLTFGAQMWRYNDDGTKIYAVDQETSGATVALEYALSTAYDLSSMSTTLVQSIGLPADKQAGGLYLDFDFCDSGLSVTWVYEDATGVSVYDKWALSTAYDLSTMTGTKTTFTDEFAAVDVDDGPRSITFAGNGLFMYTPFMLNGTTTEDKYLRQFTLASACEFPESIDTDGYTYFAGGTLSSTAIEVAVPHLEGETVCVVADGVATCGVTVTDGVVASARAGRIHVGLSYTCDIETLNITASDGDAQQGRLKNVSRVTLRFFKSLNNCFVGPDSDNLTQMDVNALGDAGAPILIGNGAYEDHEIYIEPDWNNNGRVFIRQSAPSPMTILAVIPEFEGEDEAKGIF